MRRLYSVSNEERSRIGDRLAKEMADYPELGFAYLHGSFLEADRFHDIDVGVYLRAHGPTQGTALAPALAQRLSAAIRFPVEVRILNGAPVSFLYHVLKGKVIVSWDDDLLATVIEDTVRRYLDMAPLLRQSTREAFAA